MERVTQKRWYEAVACTYIVYLQDLTWIMLQHVTLLDLYYVTLLDLYYVYLLNITL